MLSSKRNNSMLCPNCRRLISRGIDYCPHCRLRNPSSWWNNTFLSTRLFGDDQIIRTIIYVNVVMFVLTVLFDPHRTGYSFSPFAFLSPSNASLYWFGETGRVPVILEGRWWSLLSANYLHGGLLHIVFNMIALNQLGPLVLKEYGKSRMIIIYTLGGIFGFLLSSLVGISYTIGASASVCSLIGSMLFYGKHRGGAFGQAVYSQIGGWAIGIAVFGFLVPGINNWGHGGGMAAGALLGYLLGYREKKRETMSQKYLASVCIAATFITLVYACLSGFYHMLLP
jgi:rhomboid protease GluP